ncbi:WD40 repeat-like protein [Ophidiomyces ophidiicola]|nr:WD40 repeat-like protein [Ophidiomyces ophidiicola]
MLKKLNPLLSNSFLRPVAPQHVCRFRALTPKDDPFQSGYSAFLERRVLQHQKEQRVAQHVIDQRIHLAKMKHMEKYQTREWKTGDVYAPRDLSPGEMRKWRARQSPSIDVFDVLAINPLHLYKVLIPDKDAVDLVLGY